MNQSFDIGTRITHPTLGEGIVVDKNETDYIIRLSSGELIAANKQSISWSLAKTTKKFSRALTPRVLGARLQSANSLIGVCLSLLVIFIILGIISFIVCISVLDKLGWLYGLIVLLTWLSFAFIAYVIIKCCRMHISKMLTMYDIYNVIWEANIDNLEKYQAKQELLSSVQEAKKGQLQDDNALNSDTESMQESPLIQKQPITSSPFSVESNNESNSKTAYQAKTKDNELSAKQNYNRLQNFINSLKEKGYTKLADYCSKCQVDTIETSTFSLLTNQLKIYNTLNCADNFEKLNDTCKTLFGLTIKINFVDDF